MGKDATTSGDASSRRLSRAQVWLLTAVIVAGSGLFAASAVVWYGLKSGWFAKKGAASARAARTEPFGEFALGPLPAQSPIVARPGKDAAGYPRDYVDRVAVRSLFGHGKYRELTDYFEQFQAALEADFHNEYFINDATEAFESAEPALTKRFEDWIKTTPDSFAPFLARAAHRAAVGFASRGEKLAEETHADDFKAMNAAFAGALSDLDHVLSLKPRAMPALRYELRIAFTGSARRAQFEPLAQRAFELCPACFLERVIYQVGLEPRWGGSYDAMETAARAADPALNLRFKQLPGYADCDRADEEARNKKFDVALNLAESACALGDNPDFLSSKADIRRQRGEFSEALSAATRALELRPHRSDLLYDVARIATALPKKDWQLAYTHLSTALRFDPTDNQARYLVPYVAQGLTNAGWEAHQAGKDEEAIGLFDEAAELLPTAELEERRAEVLASGFHGTDAELAVLQQRTFANPHDFYAHARLDYALSKRAEWDRIAEMWQTYVAQNPSEGRAFMELGGTLMHQGRVDEARAAVARACELGVSKACAIGKQFR